MSFPTIPLGELGDIQTGSTPATSNEEFWGGDVPFVTPGELDAESPIYFAPRTLSTAGVENARLIKANSILVCCIGSLGKTGVAGRDLVTNQQINSIKFDETKILHRYGFHACRQLKDRLISIAPATTVPIVSKSKFAELKIPVPPISEQRRIAAILDKADALRAKRREVLAHLDRLAQSIFVEMFGNPATNPKGWPLRKIGDLLASASYGTSEKSGPDGEFPVLRMNNITRTGDMDFADLKYMDLDEAEYERYLVKRGDVLFNRTNSAELVGKTAIYRRDDPMAYAGYLIRLRTNDDNDPEYLAGFLNTGYAKRILRSMCKSIIGMANINATEVQEMRIAQPPRAIQTDYRKRIEGVIRSKALHQRGLEESDNLFASLQYRAFRGGL